MKRYISNLFRTLGNASVLMALTTLMACSEEDMGTPDTPSGDNNVISWNIKTVDNKTRAFVDNNILKAQCTPPKGSNNPDDAAERVSVWGDLIYKNDNHVVEYFNDVDLAFYEKAGGREGAHWNYPGEDKYWVDGTYLHVRAYYPAKYINSKKMIDASSSAISLRWEYSTYTDQTDMIVGYNNINSDSYDRGKPVQINMRHSMAALKFKFKLTEKNLADENKLTAVWLENGAQIDGNKTFATVGTMIYGLPNVGKTMLEDSILWSKSFYPEPNKAVYKWENKTGSRFTKVDFATAYIGGTDAETIYTGNDGYILIIPQFIPEKLYLCFTTANGGADNVTKVEIPTDRGGSPAKNELSQETDPTKDEYYVMENGHRKQYWMPNNRYTYNILIDQSDVIVNVDVEPWNNYQSNNSIDF